MVEEALIVRCIAQERKAQSELYRVLHGWMLGICMRYTKDRQDGVARMNDGFLKILTHLQDRRPEVPFALWARRILINTVIDHYRTEKQRIAMEHRGPYPETSFGSEVNEFLHAMEAEAFVALLQKVPPMSRRVFNLHVIDGFAHAEVATMLGISEGTSKWHVAHARQLLQTAIARKAGTAIKNSWT